MIRLVSISIVLGVASMIHGQFSYPPREYTSSIGMKFVWIAPGTYLMGSPLEEPHRNANEIQHKVTLTRGFFMGTCLVTQEQWLEVMGRNPSSYRCDKNLPVERVSWNDCQEFIRRLRDKDQKPYRLPTEAEWEYACRAGTTTPFYTGERLPPDKANFDSDCGNAGTPGRCRTTAVASYPANPWGLFDMHGNLFEWCQDWYGDYPRHEATDPQGPEMGQYRVLRGGSWFHHAQSCRSAFRGREHPDFGGSTRGFRLCFCAE